MQLLFAILSAAAAAPAVQAPAPERPPLEARRDYRVVYAGFTGQPTVWSWRAASRRLRIEAEGEWTLKDFSTGRSTRVNDVARIGSPADADPATLSPRPDATYAYAGADEVAGHACQLWDMRDEVMTARYCLTPDGVMLRQQVSRFDGQPVSLTMEAKEVSLAPQPAGRFRLPSGYPLVDGMEALTRRLSKPGRQ